MARRKHRQWGNGSVRRRATTWTIRWREGSERRARGGFKSREDAERVLAKILGDLAQGRTGLPPDPRGVPPLATLAGPWLEARKLTHKAGDCDGYRWKKHLAPAFGHLRPADVDAARVREFVQVKLGEGLAAGTVRVLVALLSALFTDLIEAGKATTNPAKNLPRATRRLVKSTHDPATTPFLEKMEDVRRVFLALPEPLNIAFAIGAFAGLRTGEVFGLKWAHVDLATRRIHVREQRGGAQLKDKNSRMVPVLDPLLPVLAAWKVKTGGKGLVVPPMRCDGETINKNTPGKHLREALEGLGLERDGLGWYECTRHTFASHWVLNGGSIEKLSKVMGHYSVVVTERYAHLRTDLFADGELGRIQCDLRPGPGTTVQIGAQTGPGAKKAAGNTR